ncbi:TorF family putative porin [Candidatus Omnitrophota bacterium]
MSRLASWLFVWLFALSLNLAQVASAAEGILPGSPVEVSADVAIYNKYIWRGLTLDDDPVMQQGVYASMKGFTVSIWGSFDIDSDSDPNSDEVDYSIDYTRQFDNFSLSLGHTYYDFPAQDAASYEFYIGGTLDIPLSPSLTWYHDYADEDSGGGNGDYVILALAKSFHLTDIADTPISLDLSGHYGYNHELFVDDEGSDIGLGVGLTIPLTEKITLNPNINYSLPFGDTEDLYNYEFVGGFNLAFDF